MNRKKEGLDMADHVHQSGRGDVRANVDLEVNLSLTDPRGSREASFQLNAQQEDLHNSASSS